MTAHLSETKQKLLALLQNGAGKRLRAMTAGEPVAVETFPLSASQSVIWAGEQLFPEKGINNLGIAYRIHGLLNSELLAEAVERVCQRHQMLRSAVEYSDGAPSMRSFAQVKNPFRMVDLSGLEIEKRKIAVEKAINESVGEPFDLSQPPLVRVALMRENAAENVLVVAAHHLCADGWSLGVFCAELSEIYNDLFGGAVDSPPLSAQYFEIVEPERRRIIEIEAVEYFKEKLIDAPPVLDLPLEIPRPAILPLRIATRRYSFSAAEKRAIAQFAGEQNLTLFETLLAAYQLVIGRFAAQTDIIAGVPVSVRETTAAENSIGCFINVVAIRAKFDDNPSFEVFLRRASREIQQALKYRQAPFANLTGALKIERSLSRNPLFQTLFSFQNVPPKSLNLSGTTIEKMPVNRPAAPFDISVYIEAGEAEDAVTIEYNDDLLSGEIIDRIFEAYRTLLADGCLHPEKEVSRLAILSPAARAAIIHRDDENFQPLAWQLIDEKVAEIAGGFPENQAIICGQQSLTFGQLEETVKKIAGCLAGKGIAAGSKVAVLLNRGVYLAPALLGVMRSGAAYIPLDSQFPHERLRMILDDAQPEAILAQTESLANLPENWQQSGKVINLADCLAADYDAPQVLRENESAAYVIYTSGSTGKPKGVEVGHHSLANLLQSMEREPGFDSQDSMLAVTTVSFDIAALELFLPLVTGGRLIVADDDETRNPWLLSALIEKSAATDLQGTPSLFTALLNSGWQGNDKITLWCGGEKLTPALARRLVEHCGALYNLYGPTETTVWSTVARLDRASRLTIGKPIANTRVYIVDEQGELVPDGVRGEILIAGMGVARGYFGHGASDRKRFIDDYFQADGGRLFMTGDVGRRRSDGQIEIFNRRDSQVKLRGFRIELSEIDNALGAEAGILAGAASIQKLPLSGEPVLAASIVCRGVLDKKKLLENLRRSLPDYMIPQIVVECERLPMTPNGKVDRAALTIPEAQFAEWTAGRTGQSPATEIENLLADIFAEFASRPSSVNDDFFALGGNSLSAVRLLARIQKRWNVAVPLKDFIGSERSVAALVLLIEQDETQRDEDDLWKMLAEVEAISGEEIASAMKSVRTE